MSWFAKEGTQLMLRDTGQPVRLFVVEHFGFSHYPNGDMLRFIDAVANNGGNGVRVFGFFPFGKGREEEPYPRVGGGFDLERFNETYFQYVQQWADYAYRRGLCVLYELFDSVGLKISSISQYHPFGQFNNGDLRAFSDMANYLLVRHQKAYLDKVVGLLKNYPNVIFGLMNEYVGSREWHSEMARHVKSLAPNHLVSGSEEGSPAVGDSYTDIWTIHTGHYDFGNCRPDIRRDLAELRPRCGQKILSYSTDGFGSQGIACETPAAMRVLAEEVVNNGLQMFRYLDTQAYVGRDDAGNEYPPGEWIRREEAYESSDVGRLNLETYAAIASAFTPSQLPVQETEDLPEGFLHVFNVLYLEATHPEVLTEKGGKAVAATMTQGFLCRTGQIAGLPAQPLEAVFSVFIDNNTFDDSVVLIVDIYNPVEQRVVVNWAVTRKQMAQANAFNVLKLPFTPPPSSQLQVRAYYFGYAYLAIDKIAIVDPTLVEIQMPSDIPSVSWPGSSIVPPEEPPPSTNPSVPSTPPAESAEGLIGSFEVANLPFNHPEAFLDKGGRAIRATTQPGFLGYGQYVGNYPAKELEVYFSVFIDNNTADNHRILTLDVYDSFQKKLLAQTPVRRQDFEVAGAWTLQKLSFTPMKESVLEFRIYYHGQSYVAADKIAVVDPDILQFANHAQFLFALLSSTGSGTPPVNPDEGSSPGHDPNALLSIPQFTPENVQAAGGKNMGGEFLHGMYTPSNGGGIEVTFDMDTSRKVLLDFEIEGNIANIEKLELEGGKVSLFDIRELSGGYYATLQRMSSDYRGGGKMRAVLTDHYGETEGAAFLVSWNDSTSNWGDEAHRIQVSLHGRMAEMVFDGRVWGTGSAGHEISGVKRMTLVIGNRVDRSPNQHAITRFKWFTVKYA